MTTLLEATKRLADAANSILLDGSNAARESALEDAFQLAKAAILAEESRKDEPDFRIDTTPQGGYFLTRISGVVMQKGMLLYAHPQPPAQQEPTIQVSGPTGCGKSAVMEIISKALRDAGLHPYSYDIAAERRLVDKHPAPAKVWNLVETNVSQPPQPAQQEPRDQYEVMAQVMEEGAQQEEARPQEPEEDSVPGFVYKATAKDGSTCHFGVASAARAWARSGTVEPIPYRDFRLVEKPCPSCESLARAVMMDQTAHDPAPLREPLTPEQVNAVWDEVCHRLTDLRSCTDRRVEYTRAIEAAHGIAASGESRT